MTAKNNLKLVTTPKTEETEHTHSCPGCDMDRVVDEALDHWDAHQDLELGDYIIRYVRGLTMNDLETAAINGLVHFCSEAMDASIADQLTPTT